MLSPSAGEADHAQVPCEAWVYSWTPQKKEWKENTLNCGRIIMLPEEMNQSNHKAYTFERLWKLAQVGLVGGGCEDTPF